MEKLFKAIRAGDFDTVKQIIEKKQELVNCIAKQPPKKDDGQSPLQVAFKTGNTAIAEYLINMGANVNFIEDESCCNSWRTPVLHDAINCAVMCCRWNTNDKLRGFRVYSTKEKADEALKLLKKMIDLGADVNAVDSYGNSGLNRFGLQANQILPPYNYAEHSEGDIRIFTELVLFLFYLMKCLEHILLNTRITYFAVSTYPFYTLEGCNVNPPDMSALPLRGDTVIESDVGPYTVVAGNSSKVLRKRFDDELIDLMLKFSWWDKSIEEIDLLIPIHTCSDLEKARMELKTRLHK